MTTNQQLVGVLYPLIILGICWLLFADITVLPNKKRRVTILTFVMPFWAWALAGILIGIMVLAVGAFIICELYYTMKIVLPDNPAPTNNVQTTWYYDHSSASAPVTQRVYPAFEDFSMAGGHVDLQYGVCSTNGLPWLAFGTNLTCLSTNYGYIGVIHTFCNDSNCIDVVLATGGTLNRITYTATNDFTTNYPINVLIQSSTNLVDWNTILDDAACPPDAVANFSDINPPQKSNYYRIYYK